MTALWIPGATVLTGTKDGGSMLGSTAKAVWHTTENDPTQTKALSVAKYLNSVGYQVHLVWNPLTGEMVQMLPANRAGRGLKNLDGGVQTNRGGKYVFQIEVVGRASQPWTSGPCVGLSKIVAFLRQLGVPDVWPSGDLKGANMSYNRSVTTWGKSGHFGHQQVPENSHWDPGDIDQSKITGVPQVSRETTRPVLTVTGTFPLPSGHYYGVNDNTVYSHSGIRGGTDASNVARIQREVGTTADGQFGPITLSKVVAWQKSHLAAVGQADGEVGPKTWAAMAKY